MINSSSYTISYLIEDEFLSYKKLIIKNKHEDKRFAVYDSIITRNNNALIALQSEMDITLAVEGLYSPIHFAAQLPDSGILRLLIDNNADVNAITNNHITALSIAITTNQFENASILINAGAEVDQVDMEGMTSMLYAIKIGNDALVSALLNSWRSRNSLPHDEQLAAIERWIEEADFFKNQVITDLFRSLKDSLILNKSIKSAVTDVAELVF
jgi:ankyrin repeat protein